MITIPIVWVMIGGVFVGACGLSQAMVAQTTTQTTSRVTAAQATGTHISLLLAATQASSQAVGTQSSPGPAGPSGMTPAAAATFQVLKKAKVRGTFEKVRIGDILKEWAHQVEEQVGEPVMWTYGPGFPYGLRIDLRLPEMPLEQALDRLLQEASPAAKMELGYVVVAAAEHRHDGWIRLTTSGERGTERRPATPEEEQAAAERLAQAKKLLAEDKKASAKIFLEVVIKRYPTTRAAAEARRLLEMIGP